MTNQSTQTTETEDFEVYIVAPAPDPVWQIDLRPTARWFTDRADAEAILENATPEFKLWRVRVTRVTTTTTHGFELIDDDLV